MTETRPIRTFHPRRGRMGARHADAMAELGPKFGMTVEDGDRTPLDLPGLFGRSAPAVLEIGFGMGDTSAAMAAADPGRDYLAVEVHTPGIANLLALIGERGLTNIRVVHGDAMELVHKIAPDSLDAVHVFFPDPWPKARHHKRRLIQPGNVVLLRQRLRPGGLLHCATDWPHYADAMATVLAADPGLTLLESGPFVLAPEPSPSADQSDLGPSGLAHGLGPAAEHADLNPTALAHSSTPTAERAGGAGRPETKFERRGVLAGRPIADLRFRRL